MSTMIDKPGKPAISRSFSRASANYDQSAMLQRTTGKRLLERLPADSMVRHWLDLGCGTGHFCHALKRCFPKASGIGADLAPGMIAQARQTAAADHWLVADAERMPLHDECVDLIFSNLMVQWCHCFPQVLSEAARLLRPGGILALTSLCDGTLGELRHSWRQVDEQVHVNRFMTFSAYLHDFDDSGLVVVEADCVAHVMHHPSLPALRHSLKSIGANNINPGRRKGLVGRRQWHALLQAYESFRTPQGLPATYQVLYACLMKNP
ncbi:MAG: malonyl-ACP O-methyltransferase BioC [Xanthomonadaceae bacterium]|jgi:malonyl-CoA O-methyltransferase|nr:malonyl-ACP O-methyltransferase BioC [Xanthomonadaceae bacterium]